MIYSIFFIAICLQWPVSVETTYTANNRNYANKLFWDIFFFHFLKKWKYCKPFELGHTFFFMERCKWALWLNFNMIHAIFAFHNNPIQTSHVKTVNIFAYILCATRIWDVYVRKRNIWIFVNKIAVVLHKIAAFERSFHTLFCMFFYGFSIRTILCWEKKGKKKRRTYTEKFQNFYVHHDINERLQ